LPFIRPARSFGWGSSETTTSRGATAIPPTSRLAGLVAGTVQAHDQSVSGQLVISHAGDIGEILDAIGKDQFAEHEAQYGRGQRFQKE
jgi:hypothetical protein